MKEKHQYLDHHLFNISERMFGHSDISLGTVKYVGDNMLGLSDGKHYRCCGVFGNTLALINDYGKKVCTKAVSEWATGRKREKHSAHLELIEDTTKDLWLTQVIEDGAEFYPKSNERPDGVKFPIVGIMLRDTNETIRIFPDKVTPEILEGQSTALRNLAHAFLPEIKKHFYGSATQEKSEEPLKKSRLQELREEQRLSQSDLAKKANVSLAMIKRYELPENDIKSAKGTFLLALSNALDCTLEDLLS